MAENPDNPTHATEEHSARPRAITVEDVVVVLGSLAVFVIGVILAIAFAIR